MINEDECRVIVTCPICGHNIAKFQTLEDDYGHEDDKYTCENCRGVWYVDGIDS